MHNLMIDLASERKDGFRLQRLDVYNWGTFNKHVWTIAPGGSPALLTGANGSGKSTLVDALLTLLVPNVRRNYNQASGAEKRRERDEKTYVRGAYGRVKDSESNRGVVQFLRGKDDYSVLLAVFSNEEYRQHITLAQVFWTHQDKIDKFFVVAAMPLTVAEHFTVSSSMAELRKRLKASGAEVFDEFVQYSKRFCKLFGLRSEKALDLFNQTVSIKEIGGLNEFVRSHMLEKTNVQEKITQLRDNYENLTRAHDAILKAEQQLAQLQPLLDEAAQHQQLKARIADAEYCADAVPAVFARYKLGLLEQAIAEAQQQVEQQRHHGAALKQQLDALRQQQIDLNIAISNDTAGQRIQQLQQEIKFVDARLRDKKSVAAKYDALVRRLTLPFYSDETTFYSTLDQARTALPAIDTHLKGLVGKRDALKQDAARLEDECRVLRAELDSLKQRKSQIPSEDLRIRSQITQALGIPDGELPFIGELLKVKDEARSWEGAVERLLRGYGRQLLVPDAFYRQISHYIDSTDLRGRIVYHRVTERRVSSVPNDLDRDMLFFKLEIKPGTFFYDWLKDELLGHFDYLCCATLEQFHRERRAITVNGQIKSGGSRHEKDDRYALHDRKRYILGWDNRDKIQAIEAELKAHLDALYKVHAEIQAIEQDQKQRAEQHQLLRDLLNFDTFAAIDWKAEQQRLHDLTAQQRELEASSDRLRQLNEQLDQNKAQATEVEAQHAQTQARIATREHDMQRYERQRADCQTRLNVFPVEAVQSYAPRIQNDLKHKPLTLDTIDDLQTQMRDSYKSSAASLKGRLTPVENSMIARMVNYKRDYPADTEDINPSMEAIDEFRQMLERIQRDDLPRHAKRFKQLLDEKVITNIVMFKGALDKQIDEIKASITHLNDSLRAIDYTPATYIQLCHDPNRDREIQEFRNTLRACLPDVGQLRTPEANEASFQRIKGLIQRFNDEERWTAKVTDVRNWLDFSAEERYKEDHSVKNYYSDSSGKSGGQKAKLAYTILASAIAYQYGLDQSDSRAKSFRFVVVDEAFSKSDETNARYAMELFKKLNLQLLVVTPLDKTHIVEPYIAACHFVANNQDENDSKVYNLTMEQYREQQAAFHARAEQV